MSNETFVTIRGYACAAPVFFPATPERSAAAAVRVAVSTRSFQRATSEYVDGPTVWYSVKCYGQLAENMEKSVYKGTPLLVRGKIHVREWESREGKRGTEVVVNADAVGVEMSRGTVYYRKNTREDPNPQVDNGYGEKSHREMSAPSQCENSSDTREHISSSSHLASSQNPSHEAEVNHTSSCEHETTHRELAGAGVPF